MLEADDLPIHPYFLRPVFAFLVQLLLCSFVLCSCGFGEWNFAGKSKEVSAIRLVFFSPLCEDLTYYWLRVFMSLKGGLSLSQYRKFLFENVLSS